MRQETIRTNDGELTNQRAKEKELLKPFNIETRLRLRIMKAGLHENIEWQEVQQITRRFSFGKYLFTSGRIKQ
jgi:hypothetical protein